MRSLKFDQIKMTSGMGPTIRPAAPPQELASGSGSWNAREALEEQIQDAQAAAATPGTVPPGKPPSR